MIIDQTPLMFEVENVLNSNFSPNFYEYTAQFKIGDQVYDILKIVDIDEEADYELAYAGVMMMNVVIPLGDYSNIIFPAKNNLELILKIENLNYTNFASNDQQGSVQVIVYNAALMPDVRPFMSEDKGESVSRETQNLMRLHQVAVQLKPKLVDDINKITIGGQFLKTTNAKLVRDAITMYCEKMELDDNEKLLGVNIHPTASTVVQDNVVIPHSDGVMLFDLADYLQKKTGGIFPAGMAQYVHERVWYIYPPYDVEGYDDAKEKLVVISVPSNRFPQAEKTYMTQNGITTILATGNKQIRSDKNTRQDNMGNGAMYTDANQIVDGFSETKGGVSVIKRSKNNSEFVGELNANGKQNVRMLPDSITANPFLATSRLARSQGHFYTVEWENADPALVKPGLNAKILYLNNGDVREINGVLLKAHRNTRMNGVGMMANGHRTAMVLVFFVKSSGIEEGGLLGLE